MNGNIPILRNAPNDTNKYIKGDTGLSIAKDPEIEKVKMAEIMIETVLNSLNTIKTNAGLYIILFMPMIR